MKNDHVDVSTSHTKARVEKANLRLAMSEKCTLSERVCFCGYVKDDIIIVTTTGYDLWQEGTSGFGCGYYLNIKTTTTHNKNGHSATWVHTKSAAQYTAEDERCICPFLGWVGGGCQQQRQPPPLETNGLTTGRSSGQS